ncbi:hypothetical protein U1Q18_048625 [Sarracenia purpurea var. burkii]
MFPKPSLLLAISIKLLLIDPSTTKRAQFESLFNENLINSGYFVDKPDMIQEFYNQQSDRWTLIGAPPQFGKTTNLHMLKRFFGYEIDDSGVPIQWNNTTAYEIFKNLKIANHESIFINHLAQHPVIYLDLKFIIDGVVTEAKVMAELRQKIHQCYLEYDWMLEKIQSYDHALSSYAVYMEKVQTFQLDQKGLAESIFMLGSILHKRRLYPSIDQPYHSFWQRSRVPKRRPDRWKQFIELRSVPQFDG